MASAEAGSAAPAAARRNPRRPGGGAGSHVSFLAYRRWRYLKLALLLCAASTALYALDVPAQGRSGDSIAGYLLGTIGAALIFWLTWLGVRKRSFSDDGRGIQAWTSAHVYLGLSLAVIATLHCAFQFGFNVHTLAYVLMLLVIASGVYGITAYATLPNKITTNRQSMRLSIVNGQAMEFPAILKEVSRLNDQAIALADRVDVQTHAEIARSIGKMRIGGTVWEQLSGRYGDAGAVAGAAGIVERFQLRLKEELDKEKINKAAAAAPVARGGRNATIAIMVDQIVRAGADPTGEILQKLLQVLAQRKALVEKINRDITLRARQDVWLFIHVPLTIALLAALVAHVVSVFAYW